MSNTQNKLNEAKFFLDKMRSFYNDDPDFSYYYSAYVSAARSILWIMKAEYGRVKGWKEWHDGKTLTQEMETVFKKLNKIRVDTNKIRTITAPYQSLLTVDKSSLSEEDKIKFKSFNNKNVTITISEEDSEAEVKTDINSVTMKGSFSKPFRFTEEFPDEELVEVCEKYLSYIEKAVLECENLFSNLLKAKKSVKGKIKFNRSDFL